MNTVVRPRLKQCSRKQGYGTKSLATKAMDKNVGYNNPAFNAYECPHCFMWHFGHKIKLTNEVE